MGGNSELIIGLDVGTTKICTVVAEEEDGGGGVRVLGVGHAPSRGLRKGLIIDLERAVEAIMDSIEDAEKVANVEIHSVFAGIAGGHVKSFNSRGIAAISEGGEITGKDVARAIDAAKAISLPADREILHTIPQEFIVDGQGGIRDPVGLTGVRLEADVHIITGAIAPAQNVVKSINRAGFEVEDIVLESLASSIAVLTEDEKQSGTLLVDIGGGTTDFVIFHDGVIKMSDVLAIGGDHVTNDISMAFRLPISKAEKIKITRGCAIEEMIDESEHHGFPGDSSGAKEFRMRDLVSVIGARMEELFFILDQRLIKTGLKDFLANGVVLTGGASLMRGAVELAGREFDLPVRIGRPIGISGIKEVLDSPLYATGVGLVLYGKRCREDGLISRFKGKNIFQKIIERMRSWFISS